MSTHIASETQMAQYSGEIAQGVKPSIPMSALSTAIGRIKDGLDTAQSGDKLSNERVDVDSTMSGQANNQANDGTVNSGSGWTWKSLGTALDNVPFAVLGASPRDTRQRIVELADERSLELDPDACQKARSDLTNPRTRLAAELAWFPGLSPGKIVKCLGALYYDPISICDRGGLPALAHFNFIMCVLERLNEHASENDVVKVLCATVELADTVEVDVVLRDINEDRDIARFPLLQSAEQVETALGEHKGRCRDVVRHSLDTLPSATVVRVLTEAIDTLTDSGAVAAPKLLDDVIDSYAFAVQSTLDTGLERIQGLVEAVKTSVDAGVVVLDAKIAQLETATTKWDMIAQPIQLSYKSRGLDHSASQIVARAIRDLSICLCNEHSFFRRARQLIELSQNVFAELPEIAEGLVADADAVDKLIAQRDKEQADYEAWANEITYTAHLGLLSRNELSITSHGVRWKHQVFPLADVTRVRWGGVRHSVNGVPTGSTYSVAFGDGSSEAVVGLKDSTIYNAFVEKLWQAVCVRLLIELFQAVKDGQTLMFGEVTLRDTGVALPRQVFFGSKEPTWLGWNDVHVWSRDGSFFIGSQADRKMYAGLSYITNANIHILEQAIRMAFKKGTTRLSDALD